MPAKKRSAKGAKKSSTAALRMIRMLRLIPREPNKITARQLCERLASESFVIDKRSVERDLRALKEAEGLGCDDRGEPYGWYWARGQKTLQAADMTPAEALALVLGKKYLSDLLPPALHEQVSPFIAAAEDTLRRNAQSRRSGWRSKVAIVPATQPLLGPKRDAEVEAVIYQALLDGKQLEVRYAGADTKDAKDRGIHPLGLVQRGPVTYLVVRYDGYDNVRILAMHRIKAARRLLQDALPPVEFTLDGYVHEGAFGFWGTNAQIRLSMTASEGVATILEETPLSNDQVVDRTGPLPVVTATVHDNAVLERWLLSLGAGVRVCAPASLRNRIVKGLSAAAAAYAST